MLSGRALSQTCSIESDYIMKILALCGLPWEPPLLFIFSPSCPSSCGLSCVPLCPCCSSIMYLRGRPFPYRAPQRILLSKQPNALDKSINVSRLVFHWLTSFSICDSPSILERLGLYDACASPVSKLSRSFRRFPKMHAHILYIMFISVIGRQFSRCSGSLFL